MFDSMEMKEGNDYEENPAFVVHGFGIVWL